MNKIRIIAGRFRGKNISFPDFKDLRPTTNCIRETLFNWLAQDVTKALCLDLFAGSGALGLEAYSRGASSVVFIEQETLSYKNLSQTLQNFQDDNLKIYQQDALEYLKTSSLSFDLIFLDPPFKSNLLSASLELIAKTKILKSTGLIYFESETPLNFDENYFQIHKAKKTGKVHYGLLKITI